jgi:hypothetical protein
MHQNTMLTKATQGTPGRKKLFVIRPVMVNGAVTICLMNSTMNFNTSRITENSHPIRITMSLNRPVQKSQTARAPSHQERSRVVMKLMRFERKGTVYRESCVHQMMPSQSRSGKRRNRNFPAAIQGEEECKKKSRIALCIGNIHAIGIRRTLRIS